MRSSGVGALVVLVALAAGCRHQFPVPAGDGPVLGDGKSLDLVGPGEASPPGRDLSDGPRLQPDRLPKTDHPKADLPKPDLPAGPLVIWGKATGTGTVNGQCKTPLVGGGGECQSGGVFVLTPDAQNLGYTISCSGTATVYYACAGSIGSTTLFPSGSATAACGAGASLRLIGGGCHCPAGSKLFSSYPDPQTKTWVCTCSSGSPMSYAICAPVPAAVQLIHYQGSACLGPEIVIGGGCACTGGAIARSVPDNPSWPLSWSCACEGGAAPKPYVICGVVWPSP